MQIMHFIEASIRWPKRLASQREHALKPKISIAAGATDQNVGHKTSLLSEMRNTLNFIVHEKDSKPNGSRARTRNLRPPSYL